MRIISSLVLSLIATAAAGQTGNLWCNPNYSVPEGGAEITIRANNYHQFKAPRVYFGLVPSPRVTVVDRDSIKAVAPAHAVGIVDVMVIDTDAILHTYSPFAFTPVLDQIIIPIAYQ